MSSHSIGKMSTEEAHEYLENIRWPDGKAICPKCGSIGNSYLMQGKSTPTRTWKCKESGCRAKFTVRVGTIFEDSHIPLDKWLLAFALLCEAKKGMSSAQLQRALDLGSYRTAWFMTHRIREAMKQGPFADKLDGVVEADETFYGPRSPTGKHGRGSELKVPVLALVQRGGQVRTFGIPSVTSNNLREALEANVDKRATLMTDEYRAYRKPGREFAAHRTVNHGRKEYARPDGTHVNTAESFFGLLKRGLAGSYHFVSHKHLGRYCNEFAFRWNTRQVPDLERMKLAIAQTAGKRLKYKA